MGVVALPLFLQKYISIRTVGGPNSIGTDKLVGVRILAIPRMKEVVYFHLNFSFTPRWVFARPFLLRFITSDKADSLACWSYRCYKQVFYKV